MDHTDLEEELGGTAHKQVHLQVVVVRDEGAGSGTSSNHVLPNVSCSGHLKRGDIDETQASVSLNQFLFPH
jgi:hypothetical protein